jgi:hypothetical protein
MMTNVDRVVLLVECLEKQEGGNGRLKEYIIENGIDLTDLD